MPIVPSRKPPLDVVAALLVLAQSQTPSSGVSGGPSTLVEQQRVLKSLLEK